jgi:glycosyltransferase involved in cell wall biosynthesis
LIRNNLPHPPDMKKNIAIVISHPIQHFCPQYASLAAHPDVNLKVFFASALGYKKYIDTNFKEEIVWNNLRLEEFDHQFLNDEASLPVGKDLDAVDVGDALAAFAPDLVIIHGYFQKLQRRTFKWSRQNKVRLAYISDSERRHQLHWIKEWIKYPFIRKYFAGISFFLTVGDANEAYYRHYGVPDRKMIRMHFSIDRRSYEGAWKDRSVLNASLRERFRLSGSDLVLSVVGKLVTWKNQADIIGAMKKLEDKGVVTNLFIIGSGEQKEMLEKRAEELARSRVIFPGFVKPEDLPAFYTASDIYIHPASLEPHSLAISEAIYMGCPILISDRCGSYGSFDDVQEGKNGYVFKCGDIDDIVNKILLLATDKEKREQFGLYSHETGENFQKRSHGGFLKELLAKINEPI